MAFQKKDENRASADAPASASLLQDVRACGVAAFEERGRRVTWSSDSQNPVLLASLERTAVVFPFKVEVGDQTLRVKVRYRCTVEDCTLGLGYLHASRVARVDSLPEEDSTTVVSPGAKTELTWTVDLTRVQPGWNVFFVSNVSELDTANEAEVTDTGGSSVGHLLGWTKTYLYFNGASLGFTPGVNPGVVDFRNFDPSGPTTPTYAQGNDLPGPRQVLRASDSSGARHLWVYPPFAQDDLAESTGTSQDVAFFTPLGQVELFSVEFTVTERVARGAVGTGLNAGNSASVFSGANLYLESEQVFAKQTRQFHTGPQNDPNDTSKQDTSTDAKTWWGSYTTPPVDPVSNFLDFTGEGTYQPLCTCGVGDDDPYEDPDGSTNKTRTGVEFLALLALFDYDTSEQYAYDLRLRFETLATLAGDVNGNSEERTLYSTPFDTRNPRRTPAAYSYLFYDTSNPARKGTLLLHSLKGVWPADRWGEVSWHAEVVRAKDTDLGGNRWCHLDVNPRNANLSGGKTSVNSRPRYLVCAGFGAVGLQGNDTEQLGVS